VEKGPELRVKEVATAAGREAEQLPTVLTLKPPAGAGSYCCGGLSDGCNGW